MSKKSPFNSTETRKQRKERLKLEKKKNQHNGNLTPGWHKFTVLATHLPGFTLGMIRIGLFLLLITIVIFIWNGNIGANDIVDAGKSYLGK
ncbi:hypothetical protein [Peribacillus frigoritolerans]|uniref:hypothetical protein n=1 Tax=Peribacillus frigoritolerans TaxID=450367 RepID=UPI002079ED4C|nr:hypothetical protein [Peribacillus frigoritolerans]USK77683.1 hypothetical protein LIT31_26370 [Peribacillus frigoritolerans]USK77764.1 hypothetical protein LIT31_25900 [Peribacillus frigoritolerans]USK77904.1 hypothetical protein LIT31_26840 [Peribacillus frigoritolerans]